MASKTPSNRTTSAGLLGKAETAWLNQDVAASTAALAERSGCKNPFVHEALFETAHVPSGVSCEPLFHNGHPLDSFLVTIDQGTAVFDIGVPLLSDGTFYSHAFAHLKYPERYAHLFSAESGAALRTIAANDHHVADAYVTLIRPPYYHWLMDTVPHLYGASRLGHLEQVKLIAPDSEPLRPWQKTLLERACTAFGISNLSFLPMNGTAVAVRPGYSQTRLSLANSLSLVRSIGPATEQTNPHRLLFSRRGSVDRRQLQNEDAVLAALGERFTAIDAGTLDFDAQAALFAEARCVVGVHGSNLTNIAFCQPGTVVVEIAAGLPQPHFEKLAEAAGLHFVRVTASPADGDASEKTWEQAHGDLIIDPAAVVDAVDEALSATSP